MKGFFSKLKKNKKGYTLTELIVVVAILGVLAVIAVPMVMNAVGDARKAADTTSAKAIETAVDLCLADGTLKIGDIKDKDNNVVKGILLYSDGTQDQAKIILAIQNKLKGNKIPTHQATSDNKWKLDIHSLEVTEGDKNIAASLSSYYILD